jgi:DNA-binding PadR family transcriptional regulator
MVKGTASEVRAAPMHSAVNWALLGLVIERPSYAYELAQRFERIYGEMLSLSSTSHVYTALGTLKSRSLVEELPGTREGGQPKPRYRATPDGVRDYRKWLLAQVGEERRRQRLLIVQLTALTRDPQTASEIVAEYEQACLAGALNAQIPPAESSDANGSADVSALLIAEEDRLAVGAKLAWVQYARQELKRIASSQARRR